LNKFTKSKSIAYKDKIHTNNMIKLKPMEYSCLQICNFDTQIVDWITNFSIRTKWTSQQDRKSNNVAQDIEQCSVTLRRWNHKEKKHIYICVCVSENHLFLNWNWERKIKRDDIWSKIDRKSTPNEENEKENLKKKLLSTCWRGKCKKTFIKY